MESRKYTNIELRNMDDTTGLYIVFEEYAPGKNYDLTQGVYGSLELAKKERDAAQVYNKEPLYIAVYNEYMTGNYNYID